MLLDDGNIFLKYCNWNYCFLREKLFENFVDQNRFSLDFPTASSLSTLLKQHNDAQLNFPTIPISNIPQLLFFLSTFY